MRMTHVSSGFTTTHALTSTGPLAAALAAVAAESIGTCMPMASPPPAAADVTMNLRRAGLATVFFMMSPPSRLRLGGLLRARRHVDRRANALVGAAAADVGHRRVDVAVARVRILREQRGRRHDLSRLAVAALRNVEREPRLLDRRRARRRQPLDRDDAIARLDGADGHRA